ncbi:hypothetical protein GCM10011378_32310 [Hymenobacter glacieicola]|uniref:Uncharacterized protein n=1 Tax=Hymenobacter glacieicola TaxID=1562124 RepID=A0ABQ1X323_9BACT|nr:hypothetical protein GCM10011378_32310 [Hymenobacter glacieicola]
MNKGCFFFVLLATLSCNQQANQAYKAPPERIKDVTINLGDSSGSQGKITISLPARYDTIFNWVNHSDCTSCFDFRYRVQPKNRTLLKEDGFFWKIPQDSIERFTIVHSDSYGVKIKTDSSSVFSFHNSEQEDNLVRFRGRVPADVLLSDTVEKINNKFFSIFAYSEHDSLNQHIAQRLEAVTITKSLLLRLTFELRTAREAPISKDFLSHSRYYLRTIKLSE